jgi:hypothetical protein
MLGWVCGLSRAWVKSIGEQLSVTAGAPHAMQAADHLKTAPRVCDAEGASRGFTRLLDARSLARIVSSMRLPTR